MLTATYNIPTGNWTGGVDAALMAWSAHIPVNAEFEIAISFDATIPYLAQAEPEEWKPVGFDAQDRIVYLPSASYLITTGEDIASGPDMEITINPDWPWYFGDPALTPEDQYSFIATATHELGHGLFMTVSEITPFALLQEQDGDTFADQHFISPGPLMYSGGQMGEPKVITPADVAAAGASSIVTNGDDLLYYGAFIRDPDDHKIEAVTYSAK